MSNGNKEFEVEISRSDEFSATISTTLALPATWAELNDALEKARITDNRTPYSVTLIDAKRPYLEDALTGCQSFNLYALNFFAEQLSEIKGQEAYAFEGLVKMEAKGSVPVERLINLTRDITDTLVVAIGTDKELGEFVLENDMEEKYASLPDDMFATLDLEKVGSAWREKEHGVFVRGCYVVNNADPAERLPFKIPHNFHDLTKPEYVFRLEIAEHPFDDYPNDENSIPLNLPATTDDIVSALEQAEAVSLQECVFYRFESTVPQLKNCFGDMDDFHELNELAGQIQELERHGELPKFKALLEAAECENVFDALNLVQNLDSYNFNTEIADPCAYAKSVLEKLEIPAKDMFFEMTDLRGYGRLLMTQNDMHITEYGIISRKDGGPIIEQEQSEMCQSMT